MSVLKKEFKEKDVQRVRNLVKGKFGEKTTKSIGYTKKQEFYEEGDIWEADGRTWTIKDGIKQNVTKLDVAKKAHNTPLFCPSCKKVMKNPNDKTYYSFHKTCFDCVIVKEHEMKKNGTWEEYERQIKNNEIDNKIKDFKIQIKEKVEEKNSFVTEQGDVERWIEKIDTDKVDEHVKSVIDYLEALKT